MDEPNIPSPELDAAHALVRIRRAEAVRWAGLMLAIAPVVAWSSLLASCIARITALFASNKNANPGVDPICIALFMIIGVASPMLPIGLIVAIVGGFIRWRRERKLDLSSLPNFPLMTGERLGAWIVDVAEPDRLVMCRRPMHRHLWNPTRVIIRLAQGVLVASAIEAGFIGGGWQSALVAGAFALVWAIAWTAAMVERSFTITWTGEEPEIEFRTSIDPFWPAIVRRKSAASVSMLLVMTGQPLQNRPKGYYIIAGLCGGKLGLWQRQRLAAELRHRFVRPMQLNTPRRPFFSIR